jgi:hypothetical protein
VVEVIPVPAVIVVPADMEVDADTEVPAETDVPADTDPLALMFPEDVEMLPLVVVMLPVALIAPVMLAPPAETVRPPVLTMSASASVRPPVLEKDELPVPMLMILWVFMSRSPLSWTLARKEGTVTVRLPAVEMTTPSVNVFKPENTLSTASAANPPYGIRCIRYKPPSSVFMIASQESCGGLLLLEELGPV